MDYRLMDGPLDEDELQDLERLVASRFPVYESQYDPLEGVAIFLVTVDEQRLAAEFDDLKREMEQEGYIPMLRHEGGEHVLYVVRAPEEDYTRPWVNYALFFATVATTILAGALAVHSYENPAACGFDTALGAVLDPGFLGKGALFFALPLMGILGVHELGHYFTAKHHGVEASLPFFIPIPPFLGLPLGTMGAFISIRKPITDRKALLDIGIAGPLAGLVIAIPVVLIGMQLTTAAPQYVPDGTLTTPTNATAVWDEGRGQVYLLGGDVDGASTTIRRYDPARDTITTLPTRLPGPRSEASAVWTGGEALVFGGRDDGPTDTILRYDPGAATASTLDDRLPAARAATSAVWTGDAAYVFGGAGPDGDRLGEVVRVTPAGDVTVVAQLPTPRAGTAAAWSGDAAYVFGGVGPDGAPLDEIVRFDPASGRAEVVDRLPNGTADAAAAWTGDAVHLFGGRAGSASDAVVRYVPGGSAATVNASLPSPRWGASAAATPQGAHVFGGRNGTAVRHQIVRFDAATGTVTTMRGVLPEDCGFVTLGGPVLGSLGGPPVEGLLFTALSMPFPDTGSAMLHTTTFAGWVGLLVTGLNLLPAGQLDGGHIFRAFMGERHKYASLGAVGVLLFFGAVGFSGWLIFALLVLVLGTYHPPPLNDITELSASRKALFALSAILLVLTFVPVPFSTPAG